MYFRLANLLKAFLLSYRLGDLKNSGHLPVQEVFEVTQKFVPWQKSSKFISSHAKVAGRSHDPTLLLSTSLSCHVMSRHSTLCHVMSRHVTSCHVMSRRVTSCHHFTSCHVMSCHATSCHVMPRHVTSCHVISRHVTSRHIMSCHVMSGHVTSYHVESRGTVTRPTLHCQLTFSTSN